MSYFLNKCLQIKGDDDRTWSDMIILFIYLFILMYIVYNNEIIKKKSFKH